MKPVITGLMFIVTATMVVPAYADRENWYSYWGIGFSDTTYPEPLESALNLAESAADKTRIKLDVDILGFYFPVGDSPTIAGFVINGAADRIDNNIQLNLFTYGVSFMTFLGKEPGDGVFFRGDFGIAKAVATSSISNSVGSNSGTGLLMGAGYGFAVSPQYRMLLNLNYTSRIIKNESYNTVAFSVGILF